MARTHSPRIHLCTIPNLHPLSHIHHWQPALLALDQFQGLTSWQLGRLLFHHEQSQKRAPRHPDAARQAANTLCLRRLKTNGFVTVAAYQLRNDETGRWERQDAAALTEAGRQLLRAHIEGYIPRTHHDTPRTVAYFRWHDHLVNEVGVALAAAAKWEGYRHDWVSSAPLRAHPALKQAGLIPDGFLTLARDDRRWPLFIEYDNDTERLTGRGRSVLSEKLRKYRAYFARSWDDDLALHGTEGPRLLFVVKSPTKLASLVALAESLDCDDRYLFAPLDYFLLTRDPADGGWFEADPLGVIWRKCGAPGYFPLL